jgi:HAD superfamily hydrolase (TIGR01509 family)
MKRGRRVDQFEGCAIIHRMLDSPKDLPRAVLFDMDGTLTEPMLDFPRIKAEMGIGTGPILESLAQLDESRRTFAEAILLGHEKIAAEQSRLNVGCRELLDWLRSREIPMALITRNSRISAATVTARHGLCFDALITREDGPFKPDPYSLALACDRLGVKHDEAWMVGDGQYDVEAAIAAGIRAVWISHGKPRQFSAEPWLTVANLPELIELLRARSV